MLPRYWKGLCSLEHGFVAILILSLLINLSYAANQTYTPSGDIPGLKVVQGDTYNKGTILLRLKQITTDICEPAIFVRLLHPNNTWTILNLFPKEISTENFCTPYKKKRSLLESNEEHKKHKRHNKNKSKECSSTTTTSKCSSTTTTPKCTSTTTTSKCTSTTTTSKCTSTTTTSKCTSTTTTSKCTSTTTTSKCTSTSTTSKCTSTTTSKCTTIPTTSKCTTPTTPKCTTTTSKCTTTTSKCTTIPTTSKCTTTPISKCTTSTTSECTTHLKPTSHHNSKTCTSKVPTIHPTYHNSKTCSSKVPTIHPTYPTYHPTYPTYHPTYPTYHPTYTKPKHTYSTKPCTTKTTKATSGECGGHGKITVTKTIIISTGGDGDVTTVTKTIGGTTVTKVVGGATTVTKTIGGTTVTKVVGGATTVTEVVGGTTVTKVVGGATTVTKVIGGGTGGVITVTKTIGGKTVTEVISGGGTTVTEVTTMIIPVHIPVTKTFETVVTETVVTSVNGETSTILVPITQVHTTIIGGGTETIVTTINGKTTTLIIPVPVTQPTNVPVTQPTNVPTTQPATPGETTIIVVPGPSGGVSTITTTISGQLTTVPVETTINGQLTTVVLTTTVPVIPISSEKTIVTTINGQPTTIYTTAPFIPVGPTGPVSTGETTIGGTPTKFITTILTTGEIVSTGETTIGGTPTKFITTILTTGETVSTGETTIGGTPTKFITTLPMTVSTGETTIGGTPTKFVTTIPTTGEIVSTIETTIGGTPTTFVTTIPTTGEIVSTIETTIGGTPTKFVTTLPMTTGETVSTYETTINGTPTTVTTTNKIKTSTTSGTTSGTTPTSTQPTTLPSVNGTVIVPNNHYGSSLVINVYAISTQYILITYYCDLPKSTKICGLIIDWSGNTQTVIDFGEVCTSSQIIKSVDDNYGFIRVCFKNETRNLIWTTYPAPNPNTEYKPLCNGTISANITEFDSKTTHVFSVENGKYGIVIAINESSSTYLDLYWINTNCEINGPFKMMLDSTSLTLIEIYQCNMAYQSSGYNCLIYIGNFEFINIVFFYKGTVNGTTTFTIDVPDKNPFCAMTLYHGGYIVLVETVSNITEITGLVVSNEGELNSTGWGLPDIYKYLPISGVTYENTVWAVSVSNTPNSYYNYTYESWSIVKSTSLSDYGVISIYGTSVYSTSPANNAIIEINTSVIIITYNFPISNSSGYIYIYFSDETIPRFKSESNNTQFIVHTSGSPTLNITIPQGVICSQNSTYHCSTDDGFVRNPSTEQDLIGTSWQFNTSQIDVSGGGKISVIILLIPDATKIYVDYSSKEKLVFINNLRENIATALYCSLDRLNIPIKWQYKRNTKYENIFLRVDFSEANNASEIGGELLASNLDSLIKNGEFTIISQLNYTKNLDHPYGAHKTHKLWHDYWWLLLIFLFILFLLFAIWIFMCRRHKKECEKENSQKRGGPFFAVFLGTFILIDFILDIIFIILHGQDKRWLFPTSIVFLVVPIGFCIISTFFFISRELKKNEKFARWWSQNSKTALIITIFSTIDTEYLCILYSYVGGYKLYRAPFEQKTKRNIIIVTVLMTIIEDIPQLIFLSIYQTVYVVPNIVPILTLISCIFIIILKILFLIFFYDYSYSKELVNHQNTKNVATFDDGNQNLGGRDDVSVGGAHFAPDTDTHELRRYHTPPPPQQPPPPTQYQNHPHSQHQHPLPSLPHQQHPQQPHPQHDNFTVKKSESSLKNMTGGGGILFGESDNGGYSTSSKQKQGPSGPLVTKTGQDEITEIENIGYVTETITTKTSADGKKVTSITTDETSDPRSFTHGSSLIPSSQEISGKATHYTSTQEIPGETTYYTTTTSTQEIPEVTTYYTTQEIPGKTTHYTSTQEIPGESYYTTTTTTTSTQETPEVTTYYSTQEIPGKTTYYTSTKEIPGETYYTSTQEIPGETTYFTSTSTQEIPGKTTHYTTGQTEVAETTTVVETITTDGGTTTKTKTFRNN